MVGRQGRARGRDSDLAAGRAAGRVARLAGRACRIACGISPNACGPGRWPTSGRGGWCRGLPIAFGVGIVLYFTADREPSLWAAAVLLSAPRASAAVLARRRPVGVSGRARRSRRRRPASPPPPPSARSSPIRCWPRRPGTSRSQASSRCARSASVPTASSCASTRSAGRGSRARPSGCGCRCARAPRRRSASFVEFQARLTPPLQPLRPGGYDFARDLYFQRIGASGFVLGRIRTAEPPRAPSLRLRCCGRRSTACATAIDKRIRAVVPGDHGSIASALITGKRDAISAPVNDAMYVSSLGARAVDLRLSHGGGGRASCSSSCARCSR